MYESLITPPAATPSAPGATSAGKSTASPEAFVAEYLPLAQKVSAKTGVAPDILLGQWGLETGWGKSIIPGTNNLGNIKDFSGSGPRATDNMNGSVDSYRKFATPDEFGDHFTGLLGRKYQGALHTGEDPAKYFGALKKGGYAEDPNYVASGVGATERVRKAMGGPAKAAAAPAAAPYFTPSTGKYASLITPPEPTRTMLEAGGDLALGAGAGVVQGVGMVASAFGADNAVARGADKISQDMVDMQSPARKAQRQNRAEAIRVAEESGSPWQEIVANVAAFAEAPIETSLNAIGTSAPTLLMAAIPGLGQTTAARLILQGAMGAGQGAGAVKGSIYESVERKLIESGMSPDDAAKAAAGAQAYDGENRSQIAAGAILGMLAGGTGIEASLGKIVSRAGADGAARGLVAKTALGIAKEAPMEGVQGGQERIAANTALQNEGFDVPTFQGVAGQAAGEAAASVIPGGVFGAIEPSAPAKPAIPPALQPVAEKAAEPNSPLSRAAMASNTPEILAQRDAEQTAALAAEQQAAQPAPEPVDEIGQKTEAIAAAARAPGFLDSLRSETSPADVKSFLKDLSIAQSKSTPAAAREQALTRLEFAMSFAGQNPAPAPATSIDEIVGETPEADGPTGERPTAQKIQAGADRDKQLQDQLAAATTEFDREQIRAQIQENLAQRMRAPEREAEEAAAEPAPISAEEQARLEAAALAGAIDGRRKEDDPRQAVIDRAMRSIEERGGVASPEEARIVQEANLGTPYDRIDPTLSRPLSTDETLTQATGIALGNRPRSSQSYGDDTEAGREEAARLAALDRANERGTANIGRRPEPAEPAPRAPKAAPSVADVTAALRVAPFQRTAEHKVTIDAARQTYTADQMRILEAAASAPATLSATDRIQLQDMGVDRSADRDVAESATNVAFGANGQPESGTGAPNLGTPASQPAVFRKRKATLRQLVDNGFNRAERRADGYYLVGKAGREFKLDGPADAQLARAAIAEAIRDGANQANTNPTEAQAEAGNYKKGRVEFDGLKIAIENPTGSTRSGTSPDGARWETTLTANYGDVTGTESADGDAVDVYLVDNPRAGSPAFVIDQYNDDGSFDETKTVLGVADEAAALRVYDSGFSDGSGPRRRKAVTQMSIADFKAWAHSPAAKKPAGKPVPKRQAAAPVEADGEFSVRSEGKDIKLKRVSDEELAEQDSAVRGGKARRVSKAQVKQLRALAAVFGKEIQFFSDNGQNIGDGFVRPGEDGTVYLNESTTISPLAVFGHELTHLLQRDIPEAHAAFMSVVAKHAKADGLAKMKAYGYTDGQVLNELTSDIAGDLMTDGAFWGEVFDEIKSQNGTEAQGIIAKLAAMVYEAIARLTKAIKQPGFESASMVNDMTEIRAAFKDALAGYVKRQGMTPGAMSADVLRSAQRMKKGKEGLDAPAGQPQTETAAFKRWFGDSKVVDENGNPLVVYHGTSAVEDFASFDFKKRGETSDHPTANYGMFFSASPAVAGEFANFSGENDPHGQRVMPLYLSIKNPARMSATTFRSVVDNYTGKMVRQSLSEMKALGHDGIHIPANPDEGMEHNADVWVAFNAKQIKSSIGNDGSFDSKSTDITRSANRSDALTVDAYHFSKEPRATLVTGAFGTGLKGSDREEIMAAPDQRLRQRLSFYVNKGTGIRPEAGVGGVAHKAELTNIYDSDADAKRLKQGRDKRAFESAVLNAGYSGYLARLDGNQPGQVILLGSQSVRPEILGPRTSIDGAAKVPPPAARNPDIGDRILANPALPNGSLTPSRWSEVLRREMPGEFEAISATGVLRGAGRYHKDEIAARARSAAQGVAFSRIRNEDLAQDQVEPDATAVQEMAKAALDAMPAPAASSVRFATGEVVPNIRGTGRGGKRTVFDIANFFQKRNEGRHGDLDDAKARDNIAKALAHEALYALTKAGNAVGWYDRKVKQALRIISTKHQELLTDPDARFVFTVITAITSNGQDVFTNFRMADQLYTRYKAEGRIPDDFEGGGKTRNAMINSVQLMNEMIEAFGPAEASQYMTMVMPVRDIIGETGVNVSGELKDAELPLSVILGPKIGSFFGNLNGYFDTITMDKWFMRTVNRMAGTIVGPKYDTFSTYLNELEAMLPTLEDTKGFDVDKIQQDIEDYRTASPEEQASSDFVTRKLPDLYGYARATLREYARPQMVDGKKISYAFRTDQNKNAKKIVEALTQTNEAPANGTERAWVRSVMNRTQSLLRKSKIELSNADLQAVLWYYEKDLYQKLGVGNAKAESADYTDAAAAIVGGEDGRPAAGPGLLEQDPGESDAGEEGRDDPADEGLEVLLGDEPDADRSVERDGGGRDSSGGLAPLEGAPNVRGASGPDPRLVEVAEQYARSVGIELRRQAEYVQVDEDRARRIAAAYEAMPHAPQDPEVKQAYESLIEQTLAQYRALEAAGYKFYLIDESNDPYAGNPWNAMRELRAEQSMGVFATEAGFGSGASEINTSDNPLLADTGLRWPYGGPAGEPKRVLANDLFRAVHDAFGHGIEGAGFRAQGEENAWQAHARLFTGSALGAITSETRGQNSWLNYGPKGEHNRNAKVEDTIFADQKTGLMPEWTWTEGRVGSITRSVSRPQLLGATLTAGEFANYLELLPLRDGYGLMTPKERRSLSAGGDEWVLRAVNPATLEVVGDGVDTSAPIVIDMGGDVVDGRNRRAAAIKRGDDAIAAWVGGELTRSASRLPVGIEIVEVEDGFDAMKDGKRIGRLRDNLPRGAAQQLNESANVEIVKVEPEFKGQGVGAALYDAFNEKHGGLILPSGKTTPEAWKVWKRNYPEKVEAFVAAEAQRIADGADPIMVMRSITDPDVARRVSQAAPAEVLRSASRPLFYSQLEQALGAVPARLATQAAPQWALWLKANAGKIGVKQDEIEWSGILDYLKMRGKDKVTADELQAYMRENGVQLGETVLGRDGAPNNDEWEPDDGRVGNTRYGDYTVPGGTNYREVLITLPERKVEVAARQSAKTGFEDEMKFKYGGQTFPSVYSKLSPAEIDKYEMLVREDRNSEKNDRVVADKAVNYKSSHWDQPNILAHLRLDDRTDADGSRVLFVNEIQSDWGQDGKKKGFAGPIEGLRANDPSTIGRGFLEIVDGKGEFVTNVTESDVSPLTVETAIAEAERRVLNEPHRTATARLIPAAPFVTDTKSWVALAMKRALVEAARGGYGKVAFISGEQAADLYDLSERVDMVSGQVMSDGATMVIAHKDDNEVASKRANSEEEIADFIGKEAAARLLKRIDDEDRGYAELTGQDLKVGGEGMKAFYDEIVPQVARDLAKKLGGGALVKVDIAEERYTGGISGVDVMKSLGIPASQYNEYWSNLESDERDRLMEAERARLSQSKTQLGIEITDAMREKLDAGAPLFSRGRTATGADWESPSASKFDDMVYKMQDKQIETKRVVEAIKEASGALADDLNVYLQEELYHGRAAKRTEDFVNMELNPLVQEMAKDGLTIADVEEFLHARHAKEANAVIAQRNPGEPSLQDGGSGMTNAAADAYMAALPAGDRAKLEAAAKKVDDIIAATRKLYVDYELESQDTVNSWDSMFKHYIPLQREEKEGSPGIGQGFSIKGRETKGRTGSTRKVVDILANVALQRERAIVRGEKNRVAQALVGLATANANPDFWTVDQVPTERVFNPKTGLVEDRADPMFKNRDNALVAKIADPSGEVREHAVIFNEEDPRALRMASALKNLDAQQLNGLLGASAKVTRYFASVNTQYNPVFGAVNLVRDVQGAILNLSSTPLKDDKVKIAKNTMSALRGIYVDTRAARKGKSPNSAWAKLWDEFQEVGGQTGFRDLFATSADRAAAIEKALDPTAWMDSKLGKVFTAGGALKVPLAQAQKSAGFLFDWLSDYNLAMENGVRLSAYKAGLERGLSKEQAASVAKNLTVNFNRKGQASQQAGAMYAFFNAAVQGTARLGETLFTMEPGKPKTIRLSSAGKKIVYGGILLGSIQALMLSAAGFNEDDPPEFVRERSIIIPTGGKTYISIPMPLGFHVIPSIGRIATEFALSGFKDPHKKALALTSIFADSFNPIGNAGLSMQTLAPTALDPLVALTENRDYTGKPIARESSNKAIPGHALGKDTATTVAKLLSEGINLVSGGGQYTSGVFSPTPDQIDYLIGQATGGVGRELSKVEQTALATARGEELPTYKIPLAGRFFGNAASQASEGSVFYANAERLNRIETEIKGLQKDGKTAEAAALKRSSSEAYLITMANQAERQIQKLRTQKRELVKAGAPREAVKEIEARVTATMARLNRAVESLKERESVD